MGFFCAIINNHDETTCKCLFSINFRYIHILFNFRKAGRFFLFLVHPQVMWSASHTSTCSRLWEAWELPCLFHVSLRPSHSGGSQMEWTILDCGTAFPLHGEVMENSPCLMVHIQMTSEYHPGKLECHFTKTTIPFQYLTKCLIVISVEIPNSRGWLSYLFAIWHTPRQNYCQDGCHYQSDLIIPNIRGFETLPDDWIMKMSLSPEQMCCFYIITRNCVPWTGWR